MEVNLTAILKSKAGLVTEVKQHLENLVENSRKEKGCLLYNLHQSQNDPTVFIFHEVWESREIFDLHDSQPYVKDFFGRASEFLAEEAKVIFTNRLA